MKVLILFRGLPGSGKTFLAQQIANALGVELFEADQFRLDENGNYCYRPEDNAQCHALCQSKARGELERGRSVVVANTFVNRTQMRPYWLMAKETGAQLQIVHVQSDFKTTHGVPESTMDWMAGVWEHLPLREKLI